jgi:hypothetical protein
MPLWLIPLLAWPWISHDVLLHVCIRQAGSWQQLYEKAEAQRPLLKSFPAQGITKLRMFVLRVSNPLKTMCGYIGSLDILVIALEQQLCAILNWTLSVCSTIRHIYRAYKLTSQIVHGVLWEKNLRNVMSPTSLRHWEPAKTCKALSSQKSCAILASICSTDSVFKSQVLQILLSRCTTTETQSSDLCVCVCARRVWTHDKTLNDESLWWSCVLHKKQVVSCNVLSIELQSWVPYVHLSKIPTDTSSVQIYYTDHLKQHRWKRSLKYYPVEVLWGQLGKKSKEHGSTKRT